MTMCDIELLVIDTLYQRRISGGGCFITNQAGMQLLDSGSEAIPVIENVVRNIVTPLLEQHVKEHGIVDPISTFQEGSPFAGLDWLLGAYWTLNAVADPQRAAEFMRAMPPSVVAEAVLSLVPFFRRDSLLPKVPLPGEYASFLKALTHSDVPALKRIADYVLKKLAPAKTH